MKKTVASSVAAVVTALMAVSSVPAQAQTSFSFSFGQQNRVIDSYCGSHSRDNDCRDYRRGHSHWSRNDYNRFYTRHRGGLDNLASGLIGFTFGAMLAGSSRSSNNDDEDFVTTSSGHVARCEARFRSYDERSDSYLGFDGQRHDCTL